MNLVDDCHDNDAGAVGSARDDLGGQRGVLRRWIEAYGVPLGAIHGLEERLRTGGDGEGVAAGRSASNTIWSDV